MELVRGDHFSTTCQKKNTAPMSEAITSPPTTAGEATARYNWLKAMYILNIIVALPLGLAVLLAPEVVRGVMGVPAGNAVFYGMAAGAVPLAFGLAGVLGLRAPVKISPVLGLQALYKSMFLIGVILPIIAVGQLPGFAVPLSLLFVLFIVGDLIAIPFSYLLSQPEAA